MLKTLLLSLIISSSYLMGQSHIKKIPNDSLAIWKNMAIIWDMDTSWAYSQFLIHGISNKYEFPGYIPDKKDINTFNLNVKKRYIVLTDGIYIGAIVRSETANYFFFCKKDTITLVPDYLDVPQILTIFTNFCKSEKYSDHQVIEYARKVLDWIEKRYESN